MTEPRYDYFAGIAKDTAKESDSQVIGLIKAWKRILKSNHKALIKANEDYQDSISVYTAFKAIAYARGLEVPGEDLYINEESQ